MKILIIGNHGVGQQTLFKRISDGLVEVESGILYASGVCVASVISKTP